MQLCFLYPGQGAQYPGMGKDLFQASTAVKELFALASEACGCDTEALLFDSNEDELKQTQNTQIAITLMNLSVRRYLLEHGIESDGAAGFSLGEWSAYVDAGVFSEQEVFPIVMERGRLMAQASEDLQSGGAQSAQSGMAAVIGLPSEKVDEVLSAVEGAFPANYNSSEQTVISGDAGAIERASDLLKTAGARRVIPLKVSGPFHTPLLLQAGSGFEKFLHNYTLQDPKKPLYSNVIGSSLKSSTDVFSNAVLQISSPVLWTREEAEIADGGYTMCVEAGPGKVLTGLWKKSGHSIECRPAGSLEKLDELIGELV
ncbi:MAG: ACP S-malonyltransferase [Spirochaetia bacterium]|nr:ACP S-malonyltransferase [Spirochaetia bacterium]